jgi:hypothetical protein
MRKIDNLSEQAKQVKKRLIKLFHLEKITEFGYNFE